MKRHFLCRLFPGATVCSSILLAMYSFMYQGLSRGFAIQVPEKPVPVGGDGEHLIV